MREKMKLSSCADSRTNSIICLGGGERVVVQGKGHGLRGGGYGARGGHGVQWIEGERLAKGRRPLEN